MVDDGDVHMQILCLIALTGSLKTMVVAFPIRLADRPLV